jgi:hypothetical protein
MSTLRKGLMRRIKISWIRIKELRNLGKSLSHEVTIRNKLATMEYISNVNIHMAGAVESNYGNENYTDYAASLRTLA